MIVSMREFIDHISVHKMSVAPSGYIYMLGEKNNFWFVRYTDGVELAKRPLILAARSESMRNGLWHQHKDPAIRREDAFDRLMNVGVWHGDMDWFIAGLDISDDELYRKSESIYESSKSWRVKRMFDFITNMAKMSHRFGKGELKMHFLGDGEMDSDKQPHLHFKVGRDSLASIDIVSGDIIAGDLPANYRKDVLSYVKGNLLYYKFCWDYLTGQNLFAGEYAGSADEFYRRLHKDNPNLR